MAFELRAWVNLRTNKVIDLKGLEHSEVLFDFWKKFKIPKAIHDKAVANATHPLGIEDRDYKKEILSKFSGMRDWTQVWVSSDSKIYSSISSQKDKKVYSALMKIIPLPILDKVFPGLWEQMYEQYLAGDLLVEDLIKERLR